MSLFAEGRGGRIGMRPAVSRYVAAAVCIVTALSTVPAARASLTASPRTFNPNERWICRVYQDLLHRPADPAGIATFMLALDAEGGTRQSVARTIAASPEFRAQVIDLYYRRYLGRPVDAAGLTSFLNMLAGGATLEQVRAAILGSPEYFKGHGGNTNDGWIGAVYHDVLGRDPDKAGREALSKSLAAGKSRSDGALGLISSTEGLVKLVSEWAYALLGRTPSTAELGEVVKFLVDGHRDEDALAWLLGSDEYFMLACDGTSFNPTQMFVLEVYKRLLQRRPSMMEMESWSGQIAKGMSRAQFVRSMETSTEGRAALVRSLYSTFLHRNPTSAELSSIVSYLMSGKTVEQLKAWFLGSAEYYQSRAGSNVDYWITALYKDLLNRSTDDAGRSYVKSLLAAGKGRGDVALIVQSSTEGMAVLVNGWYTQWLGRDASQGERNDMMLALKGGRTDDQLIGLLLGSPEFFTLSGSWVFRGRPFAAVLLTFADSNHSHSITTYKTKIDWGDGGVSEGSLVPNGSGFDLVGKHTYVTENRFVVHAAVSDGTFYADAYTCVFAREGRPILFEMKPGMTGAGSQNVTVSLRGVGFNSGASVRWNDAGRQTQFVNSNEVHAVFPASDLTTAGSFRVSVLNAGPWGASDPMPFYVIPAPPVLKALSPNTCTVGAVPMVEIQGTGFTADSSVYWGSVKHDATFVSATLMRMQLKATDTAAPGAFPVAVQNKGQTGMSNALPFAIVGKPAVSTKLTGVTRVNAERIEAKFEIRNDGTAAVNGVKPVKAVLRISTLEIPTDTNLTAIAPFSLKPGETKTIAVTFTSSKLVKGLGVAIGLMGAYDPAKTFDGGGTTTLP